MIAAFNFFDIHRRLVHDTQPTAKGAATMAKVNPLVESLLGRNEINWLQTKNAAHWAAFRHCSGTQIT
ncbi:hypothetical protein [Mesorhizobium sp. CO1-1-8]|uniref:hypothetical protein n=1 Tax=Mesorhizobium sp. CO1-1-8 TaxID=2876631 RepID=UPI001CD09FF2|nr:hypothetical protein [Mesorhizobium sp. CO1-1-8]MBZ9770905.1 hypothetical protein [Mesorhizobium sp. CO1-1-8]